MSTRVVCPDCGDRLKLHKPAIDSTRVKCRNCGGKFYAGKAENWSDETEFTGSFHPLPGSAPAVATATAIAPANLTKRIEDEFTSSPEIQGNRQRIRLDGKTSAPAWAMPVGILAVLGIAVAGIFFGQTPAVPEFTKEISTPTHSKAVASKSTQPDAIVQIGSNFRPADLIGIWETSDVPGGRLDFAADGTIHIRGAFLNQETLDLVSRWYTARAHGNEYVIEIGQEPKLIGNHGMRLVKQADGSLLMTRYTNVATLNIQERRFTKAQ